MAYETNSTVVDFNSSSIYGWRTGKRGGRKSAAANSCEKLHTFQNPFDYSIDWRVRYVKVKEKVHRADRPGYYYRTVKRIVPYPFYTFKKQTRTITEWRLIYDSGSKTIAESGVKSKHIPEILLRMKYLKSILDREYVCKALSFRSADQQHNCTAWSTSIEGDKDIMQNFNSANHGKHINMGSKYSTYYRKWVDKEYTLSFSPGDGCYLNYGKRFWLPFSATLTGPSGAGISTDVCTPVRYQWTSSLLTIPLSIAFDSTVTIPTLTAMLWPDSADFEDSNAQPLVDIAEALSDGVFPLGPPPDPKDAHDRMLGNLMSDAEFSSLRAGKNAIDFASNLWLWDTLVLSPVISSAIALSTSVKANDLAIDKYASIAKKGQWMKGKSLRFLSNPQGCIVGGPLDTYTEDFEGLSSEGDVIQRVTSSASIDVKQAEGNAMMVYKLNELDAAVMNTSGMRLSQFFNRLSTDLDSILYNVLPLSFVVDWFTSEFSGILNLKNKVYMPVSDHKLIVSYKLDAQVSISKNAFAKCGIYDKWNDDQTRAYYYGALWNSIRPSYLYRGYYYDNVGTLEKKHKSTATEHVSYYKRKVYEQPSRRTDFSGGLGMDCFDDVKHDPLNMGKTVTLSALIWGLVT